MTYSNTARSARLFLQPEEIETRIASSNIIFDTRSTLIGKNVVIGKDNTIYPGVVIECGSNGTVTIGNNNVFYPGTYISCTQGELIIGNNNEFGVGGCTIRLNQSDTITHFEHNGRYCQGASIVGTNSFGTGTQVLGPITVQNCQLHSGGSYESDDPDQRGGVLKGSGTARSLIVKTGQVINGLGNFSTFPVEQQRAYHPKAT